MRLHNGTTKQTEKSKETSRIPKDTCYYIQITRTLLLLLTLISEIIVPHGNNKGTEEVEDLSNQRTKTGNDRDRAISLTEGQFKDDGRTKPKLRES